MDEEKKECEVDEDFGDNLAELLGALSKEMKENPVTMEDDFEYPMEISGVKKHPLKNINVKKTGSLVQVRPVADEYENKTYLGIYIGEVSVEFIVGLLEKTNTLSIINNTNPAIFVPKLRKVIFGYESWWGYIDSEEELKKITDDDIDNVWYVKLLKEMIKEKDGQPTENSETTGSD